MRVLVPIDTTGESVESTRKALEALNVATEVEATILHVVDSSIIDTASLAGEYMDAASRKELLIRKAEEGGRKCMEAVEGIYGKAGIKVESSLVVGYPAEEIVQKARELKVDLILMASRRSGGRLPLGSVADKVIRAAPCPILILTPNAQVRGFKRLLVPLDGSKASMKSLDFALGLTRRFKAGATALYVVDEYAIQYSSAISGITEYKDELIEAYTKTGEKHLLKAQEHAKGLGFELEGRIRVGNPPEEILREAEDGGADLIVIGTRGRGHFGKLVLGSVTSAILGGAKVPVMVVR